MTDHDHEHDELRRRLREQGGASAPPDLAGDVMRRVRAEPRRRPRQWLRPVLVPAAAAVLLIAALVGISRVATGGSTGSAGSIGAGSIGAGSTAAEGGEFAPNTDSGGVIVKRVPTAVVDGLVAKAAPSTLGPTLDAVCSHPTRTVTILVPSRLFASVHAQLRQAAVSLNDERRVDVVLRRGAKSLHAVRITCP